MRISKQDVEQVAKLARLQLTESEVETFSHQLSHIVSYVEQLNGWDTTGVEPTAHVRDQPAPLSEDRMRPSVDRDAALANAPDAAEGCFRVPRILEER